MEDYMALLKMTQPEEADGKLKELYDSVSMFFGSVPNNAKMFGVNPVTLESQAGMIMYYNAHQRISALTFAAIRIAISTKFGNQYCVDFNSQVLTKFGVPQMMVDEMKNGGDSSMLSESENALVDFCRKATGTPDEVSAQDIEDLKQMGWSEQDIFDAAEHAARMVYTGIIFKSFKIDSD